VWSEHIHHKYVFVNKCAVARFCFCDVSWMNQKVTQMTRRQINMNRRNWCKDVRIFAVPPIHQLLANVTYAAVGVVYINLQPNMSFLSWPVYGQFKKFGKIWVGALSQSHPLRKNILHGVWDLVHCYLCIRFDLPVSINFGDINGYTKLGAQNLYQGSPWRVPSGTTGFYGYDFLLVINHTRSRILHHF